LRRGGGNVARVGKETRSSGGGGGGVVARGSVVARGGGGHGLASVVTQGSTRSSGGGGGTTWGAVRGAAGRTGTDASEMGRCKGVEFVFRIAV
jgi:hypothetical protein